jgi:ribosomal protein S11
MVMDSLARAAGKYVVKEPFTKYRPFAAQVACQRVKKTYISGDVRIRTLFVFQVIEFI